MTSCGPKRVCSTQWIGACLLELLDVRKLANCPSPNESKVAPLNTKEDSALVRIGEDGTRLVRPVVMGHPTPQTVLPVDRWGSDPGHISTVHQIKDLLGRKAGPGAKGWFEAPYFQQKMPETNLFSIWN